MRSLWSCWEHGVEDLGMYWSDWREFYEVF